MVRCDKKNGNHYDSNHLSWVFITSKNECLHLPRIFSYRVNVLYSQTIRNAWKYASISIASVSSGPSTASNTKHTVSKSFESFYNIFERKRYVFTLFSYCCLRIRKDSHIKTTNSLRKIEHDQPPTTNWTLHWLVKHNRTWTRMQSAA